MARLPDPTATSLVTEALKMAGFRTPTVEQTTRARTEWMPAILNDIWLRCAYTGNTRLKTLHTTAVAVSVDNQRMYDLPSDFDEELTITLLDGETTGTAQSGTLNTVVLAAAEDITEADAIGRYLLMTSGTSKGQYREIISYDTATVTATVHRNFDTGKTPVSGDTYLVVHARYPLDEVGIEEIDELTEPTIPGRPTKFAKHNDRFYYDRPCDKATYGMLLRYYANIHFVDLAEGEGKLITKIYRNWQGVLRLGLQMKAEQSIKASEYRETKQLYDEAVENLIRKEIPYGGEMAQLIV